MLNYSVINNQDVGFYQFVITHDKGTIALRLDPKYAPTHYRTEQLDLVNAFFAEGLTDQLRAKFTDWLYRMYENIAHRADQFTPDDICSFWEEILSPIPTDPFVRAVAIFARRRYDHEAKAFYTSTYLRPETLTQYTLRLWCQILLPIGILAWYSGGDKTHWASPAVSGLYTHCPYWGTTVETRDAFRQMLDEPKYFALADRSIACLIFDGLIAFDPISAFYGNIDADMYIRKWLMQHLQKSLINQFPDDNKTC